ncbi:hypothetical protein LTR62_004883 [Meristemomyces frigidus]|uniref:Peptidase A2 domain-containing protein n=1 Tax=Meristemomyces frigidus TaxID=1508187 RepID=A0AAN7TH59_9PEZI|nr:hypothetical protein LTR62_004883 [Meristemomyces frigidus]
MASFEATLSAALVALLAVVCSVAYYALQTPPHGAKVPPLTRDTSSLFGAYVFFTHRWDFMQKAAAHSPTGNFSFYAGRKPVIAVRGVEARRAFVESKELGFNEGYSALLAGAPDVKEGNNALGNDVLTDENRADFGTFFNKWLAAMLKGNRLKQGLPQLLNDARTFFDGLATNTTGLTDPFDSVYRMVFQFTMRTVACGEIADDPALLSRTLKLFEDVESAVSPLAVMYPWLPLWSKVKRTIAGGQLYVIFKRAVDSRKKSGVRCEDAIQYLLDTGANTTVILKVILGALFAGQLNSGVNAAWIMVYLASNTYWLDQCRKEVQRVATNHCPNNASSLKEQLMQIPIEAWENEFPVIDMCLRESIRLQSGGAIFRKNISDHAVPLDKEGHEVIPPSSFATYHTGDVHYNPSIYTNPMEYDPGRFLPDRAEDKKEQYAFLGWGVARHPCLGMRFAKLENNLIVAFFLAYFSEIKLANADGTETTRIPATDINNHTARLPHEHIWLKYRPAA